MSNDEDWGAWIEHDGSGCPVPAGTMVDVVFETCGRDAGPALEFGGASWCWKTTEGLRVCTVPIYDPILRYRVRRPKALQLLRDIVASPPKELIREDA